MNQTRRSISTDDALQLIANRQRRKILQLLRQDDETAVPLPVLVGELTDADAPAARNAMDDDSRTLLSLTHTHLPKLDDHGIVSFDRSSNVVAPGPEFDAVEPVLQLLEMHADELPTGYVSGQAARGGE